MEKMKKKSAEVHELLSFDALRRIIGKEFKKIPDPRPGKSQISLHDALMSAFAMFSLKDSSLLAFDDRTDFRHTFKKMDIACALVSER